METAHPDLNVLGAHRRDEIPPAPTAWGNPDVTKIRAILRTAPARTLITLAGILVAIAIVRPIVHTIIGWVW